MYKIKYKQDGSVNHFKARLVAKEFNQMAGIDYTENFAPVTKMVTVRLFLEIDASKRWPIHQLDINNAYFHGYIDKELYMLPPFSYSQTQPNQVCKLNKSLYRLK